MLKILTKRLKNLKNIKTKCLTSNELIRQFSKFSRKFSSPKSATGFKAILIDKTGKRTTKAQRKHNLNQEEEKYLSFNHLNLLTSIHEYLDSEKIYTPTNIQNESLKKILESKHNYFIGSSTGSGKTLCYLLPIFQILKEEEILESGMNLLNLYGPKIEKIGDFKQLADESRRVNLPFHYQYMDEKQKEEYLSKIKKEESSEEFENKKQGRKLTMANRPRTIIVLPTKELVEQVTNVAKDIGKYCKIGILGLGVTGRSKEKMKMSTVKSLFKREREELERGVDIVIGTANR